MSQDIAALFAAAEQGNGPASEALFSLLYSELHRLAQRELARHGAGMSLGTTTLLHQAYINMSEQEGSTSFPDRARFIGYASRVMRNLIIDHARNRQARKRGGQFEITTLSTSVAEDAVDDKELMKVGSALEELSKVDPALAEIVDLKFFCGFSFAEIAAMRNITERTVQRRWREARLYLHRTVRADLS
ncbi:MAG TPA: ECF-type sigma factor [Candidatus Polarisedimenticolia bacterium]|nr:ECF-type sigma factor [Candidatus Polarisedimenticolia bacterium]